MKPKKFFITADIWLASALVILLKISPEFKVESGVAINAYDYAQTIKKLKIEMLTRRRARVAV